MFVGSKESLSAISSMLEQFEESEEKAKINCKDEVNQELLKIQDNKIAYLKRTSKALKKAKTLKVMSGALQFLGIMVAGAAITIGGFLFKEHMIAQGLTGVISGACIGGLVVLAKPSKDPEKEVEFNKIYKKVSDALDSSQKDREKTMAGFDFNNIQQASNSEK